MRSLCATAFAGVLFAALPIVVGRAAAAAPVSFTPFSVATSNVGGTTTFQSYDLGTTPAGRTFTTYSVSFDWAAASNFNTTKDTAIFAFVDQPEPLPGNTKFFADPGPSPFIPLHENFPTGRFGPGRLTWYGTFVNDNVERDGSGNVVTTGGRPTLLPGGSPLYFDFGQVAPYTTTTWSNVTITIDDAPLVNRTFSGTIDPTTSPRFDRPYTLEYEGANTNFRKNTPYDARPFTVDTTGIYQISTATDPISNGTGSQWFGRLFIYTDEFDAANSLAHLTAEDGLVSGGYLDQPNIIGMQLEAGRQYYLVQSMSGNVGRGGVYTGMVHGVGNLTFGVVPEPTMLGALAIGGMFALRRRR